MKAGWIETTVGKAFTTATGGTPPKNDKALYGDFLPLVKPPELCDVELDTAEDGLSEEGARIARIALPNSILVSCIGNLGKIGLNSVPVAFNQQINAILPDLTKATPWFMFYQTLSYFFKSQLESLACGTTVPIVNKSKFNSIKIVLPPIPEQRRIVAILDEAFDGIATAKSNAEKNLQNARALFESHLQSVFSERGEGWVEKPLEDLAKFSQGFQVSLGEQSTKMADGLVRFIRIVDYTQQTTDVRFIKNPRDRYWVTESDIVMVRYGTPGLIGRNIAGVIANNLFKISVLEGVVSNDYLSNFLRQSTIQHYLANQGSSTMPALTFKQLGKVVIKYPPNANEQGETVRRIEDMCAETQRLESLYQSKLATLEELKQSLLHQAFSGLL